MNKPFKCECGGTEFLYFVYFSRCKKCLNEYKLKMGASGCGEHWMRRYNLELEKYNKNWEHAPLQNHKVRSF